MDVEYLTSTKPRMQDNYERRKYNTYTMTNVLTLQKN
jgi:hypothetical protein